MPYDPDTTVSTSQDGCRLLVKLAWPPCMGGATGGGWRTQLVADIWRDTTGTGEGLIVHEEGTR
jgi:hypothetical protein